MDLNMYVTLSECSPMVPLESMALGVPVLVGPTTTYFDHEPVLEGLVVRSPEDMKSIQTTIEHVLENYNDISARLIEFGLRREGRFSELRARLNAAV